MEHLFNRERTKLKRFSQIMRLCAGLGVISSSFTLAFNSEIQKLSTLE